MLVNLDDLYRSYLEIYAFSYWYICLQRDTLAEKLKKNKDLSKHHDRPFMEWFKCQGSIKITINQETNIAYITINYDFLHERPKKISVSKDIKNFIQNNIDLLPQEIYAQLVNPLIKQKQTHFWWSKLGQTRYKCHEDLFKLAANGSKKASIK